jgi:hypothetical protein
LHVPPLFNHLVGEVSSIERPRGLPVRRQPEGNHLTPPKSAAVVRQRAGYALAKTIVHGLLVLIT